MTNIIERNINNDKSILGTKVYKVTFGFVYHEGIIKEVTVQEHKLFGTIAKVWVEWYNSNGEKLYQNGHLEPYNPEQFKEWKDEFEGIGVYYQSKEVA